VSEIVTAPLAKLSVIPEAFTDCGVPSAPKAMTFPPASVEASAMNICTRFVAPVDQAAVLAANENGPPAVRTDGLAAVAIGKFVWLFVTTIRA